MNWQRANVQAAAAYLRDRIATGAVDARTQAVYEGLLDVLEPTRRTLRLQRELADAAQAAVPVNATRDRRNVVERRSTSRRTAALGPPGGVERRARERRAGRDRRGGR